MTTKLKKNPARRRGRKAAPRIVHKKKPAKTVEPPHVQRKASRVIAGTKHDLIRTAFDETVSWVEYDRVLRGHDSCFLIGRGWSATKERLLAIKADQEILSAAINNYQRYFQPNVWITGDPPNYFGRWIWENPDVQKFVPLEVADMECPKEDVDFPKKTPKDYPNVHFFHHTSNIDAEVFFMTPYAAWGTTAYGPDDKDHPNGGVRSSMIAALRILWHLGIRNVYLLGCDFVPHDHPHETYFTDLGKQLADLQPIFLDHQFNVFNCNRDSHLRVFPFASFRDGMLACRPLREAVAA